MSSSSSLDEELTPNARIEKKAKEVVQNLLPSKSSAIYNKTYQTFMDWRNEQQISTFSEGVFLAYFDELSKKYQPSTLWSIYSMLKQTMQINHDLTLKNYSKLTCLLKRLNTGHSAKKSKVLTAQDVGTFLNEAPDETYLATKVALIFGISGACRGIELTNITIADVETETRLQAIKLPNTKTNKERTFVISGEYLNIVKKYQRLRPAGVTTNRFFLNYQRGKCTKQVIGKNKFSGMPKEIATYLNLPNPELYTGHCFRRTSATLLADSGANITTLKRHGGWKSDQVAEGYIEESIQNKFNISKSITENIKITARQEPQPSTSYAGIDRQPSTSHTTVCPQASPSHAVLSPKPSTSCAGLSAKPSTSRAVLSPKPSTSCGDLSPKPSTSCAVLSPKPSTSRAVLSPKPSTSRTRYEPWPSTSKAIFYPKAPTSRAIVSSKPTTSPTNLTPQRSPSPTNLSLLPFFSNDIFETDDSLPQLENGANIVTIGNLIENRSTPSPTFTPSDQSTAPQIQTTETRLNLPGKTVHLKIKNCKNCTFNIN